MGIWGGALTLTSYPSLPPSLPHSQRFKSMDRFCFVDGDMGGALTLRVQNDRCHVQTFYR